MKTKKLISISIITITFAAAFAGIIYLADCLQTNKFKAGEKVFYTKGEINEVSAELLLTNTFQSIPEDVVDAFYEEDGKIVFMDDKRYDCNNDELSFGYFRESNNQIGIRISTDGYVERLYTVAHEFGHYFDKLMDNPSATEEWVEICEEEYKLLPNKNTDYNGTNYFQNPDEFFAEAFKLYCYKDKYDKVYCPKANEFIDNLVKSLVVNQ